MMKLIIGASLTVFAAVPAAAVSFSYSTETASSQSLGNTIGSQYDILTLNGVSGMSHGSGTYLFGNADFSVGLNSNTGGTYTGSFTNTGHAFGSPFTYSVPYTIIISAADTITIGGNTVTIDGMKVTFNKLLLSSGGETVSGALTATVAIPEPATWALLLTGFGLVGFAARYLRAAVASV